MGQCTYTPVTTSWGDIDGTDRIVGHGFIRIDIRNDWPYGVNDAMGEILDRALSGEVTA